jgi:predicted O-linked N-acetylglucosamine transferase (SPINDLY family)|tara:strand:- start:923 stop:1312 length:390 start_codon:yes stop_codon:yes gene_type:complete
MPKDSSEFSQVLDLISDIRGDYTSLSQSNTKILERLASLDQRTLDMKEDVQVLCHIVRDGNGQPPLAQRLTRAEQSLEQQDETIKEIHESCNSLAAAKALTRSQVIAGAVVMLLTAFLSVIGLVAALKT